MHWLEATHQRGSSRFFLLTEQPVLILRKEHYHFVQVPASEVRLPFEVAYCSGDSLLNSMSYSSVEAALSC